jgi:hypothetical protein
MPGPIVLQALRALDEMLQEEGFEGFNLQERRLRCLGHIINLAVKLLLFNGNVGDLGKEIKQIMADIQENVPAHLREARIKAWRARGVVGKLHNIIVYIWGSTIHRNNFLSQIEIDMKQLPGMMVHLDNDTR